MKIQPLPGVNPYVVARGMPDGRPEGYADRRADAETPVNDVRQIRTTVQKLEASEGRVHTVHATNREGDDVLLKLDIRDAGSIERLRRARVSNKSVEVIYEVGTRAPGSSGRVIAVC